MFSILFVCLGVFFRFRRFGAILGFGVGVILVFVVGVVCLMRLCCVICVFEVGGDVCECV